MRRRRLRKSEIRDLARSLEDFDFEITVKDKIERVENLILVNDAPCFFIIPGPEEIFSPTLTLLIDRPGLLKRVVVNMGAVAFVGSSGADIMRPGIVEFDPDIRDDDLVVIVDERNHKPLAVGKSLYPADSLRSMETGKAIKNIHHVGDKIWTRIQELTK